MTRKTTQLTVPGDLDAIVREQFGLHRLNTHSVTGKAFSAYNAAVAIAIAYRGGPAARPFAEVETHDPNTAWFPWSTERGRPNLFETDAIRCRTRGGSVLDVGLAKGTDWSAEGENEIVAIGVRIDRPQTLQRVEALTGYVMPHSAEADEDSAPPAVTDEMVSAFRSWYHDHSGKRIYEATARKALLTTFGTNETR